jgi:MoaA/NifB/PqqE/SkfB family radical SAM enzyme
MNHILFPITYECNLKCSKCCVLNVRIPVDVEESLRIIQKQINKIEWVYITGGEPFLMESLPEICDRIRAMGFKIGITTNGTLFRPEIAGHADRIGISLDGDEAYHDAYRGKGVFLKALRLFHAIKGSCETVIMSVSFKENEEALRKLKLIVEDLDPTYWQIQKDFNDPAHQIPFNL